MSTKNILLPKAWGGAIELSLFAHHYGVEMVAIDINMGTPPRYGEAHLQHILQKLHLQ
jgi:hypothetical protein